MFPEAKFLSCQHDFKDENTYFVVVVFYVCLDTKVSMEKTVTFQEASDYQEMKAHAEGICEERCFLGTLPRLHAIEHDTQVKNQMLF